MTRLADRPVLTVADLAAGALPDSVTFKVLLITNDPPQTEELPSAPGDPTVRTVTWRQLVWDDLRRDFAAPEVLRGRLGAMGIARADTVVLVGERIQFATYAYWALAMFGHRDAVVFDGPWSAFVADPFCLGLLARGERGRVEYEGGEWDQATRVRLAEVMDVLGRDAVAIVDVRSPQEFLGVRVAPPTAKSDDGALARGHIPGARHFYYEDMLAPHGGFAAPEEILRMRRGLELSGDRPEIVYCRSGHRASFAWFVFDRLLGLPGVRVYDGSWTEWGNLVGAPVQR